jgi:nickel/cobalt exporter
MSKRGVFPSSLLSRYFFLFSLCLAFDAGKALAHPMGNFSVNRWTRLSPRTGGIDVTHVIDLAEIPTQKLLSDAGLTNAPQGDVLVRLRDTLAARFAPGLVLTVDSVAVPLRLVRSSLDFAPGVADLPTARLTLTCEAVVSKTGEANVAFSDTNFEGRAGWKEIVASVGPGAILLSADVPPTDRSRQLMDYPTDPAEPPSEVTSAALRVRFGAARR